MVYNFVLLVNKWGIKYRELGYFNYVICDDYFIVIIKCKFIGNKYCGRWDVIIGI